MSTSGESSLAERAQAVLEWNRRGAWTCPSSELYPHQWLWDSCFIAIGLARYDPPRAAAEVQSLFRGQWQNGMVPHMIFADGVRDVGSRRLWQSRHNVLAPRDVDTSCITQPPLLAVAAWTVAEALPEPERRVFLADCYPRLVAHHQWLYRERDLEHRGLVTLIHPWECGLDTTPPWMDELAQMAEPWWMRVALRLHLARVVRFVRRDTRFVPACERPSDDDGLRMLVLARRAKRHDFELRRLPVRESVLVEDLAFNAILVAANRALARIAEALGVALDPQLAASASATRAALEELWDEPTGQYYARSSATGAPIVSSTVATFLPLWAGVDTDRVRSLLGLLRDARAYQPAFPVPSVALNDPEFDANRYWKGPTWVNMNWMIVQGLLHSDEPGPAGALRRATLELVDRTGFSEYFSPTTGHGFGAEDFSWTAALVVALLADANDLADEDTPVPD
jgi:hypothetical protein